MLNPELIPATFASLGLPTELVSALAAAGIATPFPVQEVTIPDALAGRDVLGRARTGSGKTLAFGLPMLTRLAQDGRVRPRRPRALVLVPTRELALQVVDALHPMARSVGLSCRAAVGGMSFVKQVEALRRGVDLLVATPGRLSDHVRQGTCELGDIAYVAIDEADQMADMGFLPQVREILDLVERSAQVLLFSATLDGDVDTLVKRYLNDPVTHSVVSTDSDVASMEHHLLFVSKQDKPDVVAEMAARDGRTILFVRTKHHVDRLADKLRSVGVSAGALHGGKTQGARNRVLSRFKEGNLPVLVATDVAARGIHVDGVSLVVHVDPPADSKDYLHRAGRTARAGESGTVVTVVTHDQRRTVLRLTDRAGVSPSTAKVRPGDEELVRITGARVPSGVPLGPDVAPISATRGRRGDGERPRRFDGDRPRRFERSTDRSRGARSDRPARFGGERSTDRPASFSAERPAGFSAERPAAVAGERPARFGGDRPARFSGNRSDERPNRFSGERSGGFSSTHRSDDRPRGFSANRPNDRPRGFNDRSDARRSEGAPAADDRPRRAPATFDSTRAERPARDDRYGADRPAKFASDRRFGTDRPARDDRFGADRPAKFDSDRRFGADRSARFDNDRPNRYSANRADDRSSRFSTDRPARFDGDRRFGTDRPSRYDAGRPSRADDRSSRFGGSDRRAEGGGDRPRRFDSADRPRTDDRPRRFDSDRPRQFTGNDRPSRSGDQGSGRPQGKRDFNADRPRRVEADGSRTTYRGDAPKRDTRDSHRVDDRARKPRHSQTRHDRPADPHPRATPRGWREGDRRHKSNR
ncbi:DEAD/DEAH box helicase [Actinokineospora sp. 24-640]